MAVAPRASYRLQLGPELTLDRAADLTDYLAALGVSHLYLSPVFQAAPGSAHGYDVVDPGRVSRELGGPEAFERLLAAARRHGLQLLVDIVPNHMAVASHENAWWWDVLENGPSSAYAGHFDVEWDPPDSRVSNKVLLPVLPDHYGRVLEEGGIRLSRKGGAFTVHCGEHVLPVSPRSLDLVLGPAAVRSGSDELTFSAEAHAALPDATATDSRSTARRHRGKEVLRAWLARLLDEQPALAEAVDASVARLNGDFDELHELLELQNYRLAFWRLAAGRDLGYRRFFDINSLVGLRVEDDDVFEDTQRLALSWLAEGRIDGVRIDHPDGLRTPAAYLRRLRERAPHAWIVVEKILVPGERLRPDWPVDGTTGYDFLARADAVCVDPAGLEVLERLEVSLTGRAGDFAEVALQSRFQVLDQLLGSDLARLSSLLLSLCEQRRRHRDHTRTELRAALAEVVAGFPVYRSYVDADDGFVPPEDERLIEQVVTGARERRPDLPGELLDLLRDVLLLRVRGADETELVMRLQQLCAPVMAKGVEDTAFYRHVRLLALNEVGNDPGRAGLSVPDFHKACEETARRWPRSLLCSSTHDTKRSEDVRARLLLLAEVPERWADLVRGWFGRHARHRRDGAPAAADELLLYQTLLGAWPLSLERATTAMEKSIREARRHTSWTSPDEGYEAAVRDFVTALLADEAFAGEMEALVAELEPAARVLSLTRLLLKLACPGVPDVYQGNELWEHRLVDPDNRRPVDFEVRRQRLAALEGLSAEQVLARADEGLPKLHLLREALALRRRLPESFGPGSSYRGLPAEGARAGHVLAFARGDGAREGVVALAPRLPLRLAGRIGPSLLAPAESWQDTALTLPDGRWRDVLTGSEGPGGRRAVAELLARFPVALLERTEAPA